MRARLKAALENLIQASSEGLPMKLYDATTAFYAVIFDAAGHHVAWEIVQRLNGRISRLRALTLATSNRCVSGPAHMARICEAICASQPEAAARAVNEHLDDAADIARQALAGL